MIFNLIVAIVLVGIGIALLLPSLSTPREARDRSSCKNNLKQIGLALHNYHDTYGVFPPAYTVDADGNRLHSWRTLILPFIDQESLYQRIDLTRPWNDPANAEALQSAIPVYRCPAANSLPNCTGYLAIVTPQSILRPETSLKMGEIEDGMSSVLLVFEVSDDQSVPWMAPNDANEGMVIGLSKSSELSHREGTQVLLADGAVRFFSTDISGTIRRALMTAAGEDSDMLDPEGG